MCDKMTLVIGVGSEIRGDDGIGPVVASRLAPIIGGDIVTFDGNGLDLLSYFSEPKIFDRVVVIDSLDSGELEEGSVAKVLPPSQVQCASVSSHHVGILDALSLARRFGIEVPSDLRFYAIGIRRVSEFREGISEALRCRINDIVSEIASDLTNGAPE